jgi:hypothetical protein
MKRNRLISLMVLLGLWSMLLSGVVYADSPGEALARALDWLKTQQNSDGGFGSGFGPGSAVGPTADAVIAITSAGQDASSWTNGGASPIDYLRAQAGSVTASGEIAKVILAAVASGQHPRAFGGRDLVAALNSGYDASRGAYSFSMFDQALAILALRNAGEAIPDAAVDALLNGQTTEGGWAFTGETIAGAADSNTTSLAVQALVAAGRKDATGRALDYFRRAQNPDAGWTYQVPSAFGTETDANSTALGVQAILATGGSLSEWLVNGSDPLGALLALQNGDGSFSFQSSFRGPNALATLQAIPAIAGATLVQAPAVRAASGEAPVLLPVAGAHDRLEFSTFVVAAGVMLIVAGHLLRRRVRVS